MKEFPPLEYYKIYEDSQDIFFSTMWAACFDVAAYLKVAAERPLFVKGFNKYNIEIKKTINLDKNHIYSDDETNGNIDIFPGERLLIPSGLILNIPEGFSVRTHPRSSTGYKIGLCHAHDEGIIDADYYYELFLLFMNVTQVGITIKHNQKLSQLEMIEKPIYELKETKIKPIQKTNRIGGFGSTG